MAEPKSINFPSDIPPTTRVYTPGSYPEKGFQSINGATVRIRYGRQVVDAKLTMTFENITGEDGLRIIDNYYKVNKDWNFVDFYSKRGLQGMEGNSDLKQEIRQRETGTSAPKLRWRYAKPPAMTSKNHDRCSVSCEFRGFLDG